MLSCDVHGLLNVFEIRCNMVHLTLMQSATKSYSTQF